MTRFAGRLVLVTVVGLLVFTMMSVVPTVGTPPAQADIGSFVVDSTGDEPDADPADLICRTATDTCTLRAAIGQANHSRGPNTIGFDIAGAGPHVITVSTLLPTLSDRTGPTSIDGYTQPGASPNTAADGSNAVIRIELRADGALDGGLIITSAANQVRGLAINRFDHNIKIQGLDADGNSIVGNFIGPTASGDQADSGSIFGMLIELGASRNMIGTPALADRNIISGNGKQGIRVNHGETGENLIQNNVIGLKPDLSDRLEQNTGVDLQWYTWGNMIGGFGPGEGNLISGNQMTYNGLGGGVDLSHSAVGNLVVGNFIGTLADGNSATTYSRNVHGMVLKDNPVANHVADNVIVNSMYEGIRHRDNYTGPNTFVNNRIGVGIDGAALGNTSHGVLFTGHDTIYRDNIIANNGLPAFSVVDRYPLGLSTNYPAEKTERNVLSQNTMYNNGSNSGDLSSIDITPDGPNPNDEDDLDDGPNTTLNHPKVIGRGPGRLQGTSCGGCTVEVMVAGTVTADGGLEPGGAGGIGHVWIGRAVTDADGAWSLASPLLVVGEVVTTITIDTVGNTSEPSAPITIPSNDTDLVGSTKPALDRLPTPPPPSPPHPYIPDPIHRIQGTATFTEGGPVAGVGAQLFTRADGGGRGTWLASTFTDTDGHYALYPPTDDCWVVTFIAPVGEVFTTNESRWLNQEVCSNLEEPTLDAVVDLDLLNLSARAPLTGLVTRAGVGVAGVGVDLFTSDGDGHRGDWVDWTRTGADGTFELMASTGCWALTYTAPVGEVFANGTRYQNVFLCVDGGHGTTLIPMELVDPSTGVRGTVTLSTGGPAPGVGVQLFTQADGGGRETWVRSTTTDASGSYSLTVTGSDCWVITFVAPEGSRFEANGSAWLNEPVCLVDGQATVDTIITDPAAQG